MILHDAAEMRHEAFVRGSLAKLRLVDGAKYQQRIVPGCFPEVSVKTPEQLEAIMVPGPPQVIGQITLWFEATGSEGTAMKVCIGFMMCHLVPFRLLCRPCRVNPPASSPTKDISHTLTPCDQRTKRY